MTSNLTALIDHACALKQLMNDTTTTLYGRLRDPDAFSAERVKAGKVLTRQYAPAIGRIVEATTHDDLIQRRGRLDRWLNKRWGYCSLHPEDQESYEEWETGLLHYTVISDALDHIGLINGTLDRIGWIESFVRPLEQGVLV